MPNSVIHNRVSNDGDGAVEPGEGSTFVPNEIRKAFIVGVDGDGSVAEEGLGPGGGDGEEFVRVGSRAWG